VKTFLTYSNNWYQVNSNITVDSRAASSLVQSRSTVAKKNVAAIPNSQKKKKNKETAKNSEGRDVIDW
jgi:hypothetical protein